MLGPDLGSSSGISGILGPDLVANSGRNWRDSGACSWGELRNWWDSGSDLGTSCFCRAELGHLALPQSAQLFCCWYCYTLKLDSSFLTLAIKRKVVIIYIYTYEKTKKGSVHLIELVIYPVPVMSCYKIKTVISKF